MSVKMCPHMAHHHTSTTHNLPHGKLYQKIIYFYVSLTLLNRKNPKKNIYIYILKGKKTNIKGVWYMHLKIENICLKTCVKIYVGEKVCKNMCNVV